MEQREAVIRRWFGMWRDGTDSGIREIFSEDAVYIESWGPEYRGVERIRHWFQEWNTRGRVLQWEIKQYFHGETQSVVQWYFENAMDDGRREAFDGMSLVRWNEAGKICFLQEFGCNKDRYDPYQHGPVPVFRAEKAAWF